MTVEWDLDMSVSWVEIKIGLEKLCLSAKLFFFLICGTLFVLFIGEEGLLSLNLLEKMVVQNNYRQNCGMYLMYFSFKKNNN